MWDCTMAIQVDTDATGAATVSASPAILPGNAFAGTPQELGQCAWADPTAPGGMSSRGCRTRAVQSDHTEIELNMGGTMWYNVGAGAQTAIGNPAIELAWEVRWNFGYPDQPDVTVTLVE